MEAFEVIYVRFSIGNIRCLIIYENIFHSDAKKVPGIVSLMIISFL